MTPVHCRTKHDPPHSYGDCVRACIASMLDMKPEDVPHFWDNDATTVDAMEAMRQWLAPLGLAPYIVSYPPVPVRELLAAVGSDNPTSRYLLFGTTGDGGGHCVVARGGEIEWNPAWAGGQIVTPMAVIVLGRL